MGNCHNSPALERYLVEKQINVIGQKIRKGENTHQKRGNFHNTIQHFYILWSSYGRKNAS